MIRLIISMAMLIGGAAGCASPPPPAAAPGADSVATASTSNEAVAGSEATAGANDEENIIKDIEAPRVALTSVPIADPRDEMVCRREHMTGSHFSEKVCRLRSEIDQTREETQRVLRRMERQTGASAPSN